MTEIAERYRRLSDAFATTVSGVADEKWSNPTPCDDWTVRDLVGHVVGTQGMFLGFIGEDMGELPSVDDDPTAAWDSARARIQDALDDPARATTTFTGFFGESTFEAAVDRFLDSDLLVHGWDLAHATGQDETITDDDAERVLDGARAFGDAFRSPGVCGPEISVPDDAPVQTRLLAFYGRAG